MAATEPAIRQLFRSAEIPEQNFYSETDIVKIEKGNGMKHKLTSFIIICFGLVATVAAQPDFPDAPSQAPIGGLGLLAAAGGALAIKKLIDRHKK